MRTATGRVVTATPGIPVASVAPTAVNMHQVDLRRPEHSSFRRASIAAHFIDYLLYLVIHVSAGQRGLRLLKFTIISTHTMHPPAHTPSSHALPALLC